MDTWGWDGSAHDFLSAESEQVIARLRARHEQLMNMAPSQSQIDAWIEEVVLLKRALQTASADTDISKWSVILEYELPLEGGRRPDAIVLAGRAILVLEFKQSSIATQAAVDQTEAYARDLGEYHLRTHGIPVAPLLVLTQALAIHADFDPVLVLDRDSIGDALRELSADGRIDLSDWLRSSYEPLPTLVAAARRIFAHEHLPHVRQALAQDIPGTITQIDTIAAEAEARRDRHLVLLSGVPGSGKTLVGLRLVYEQLLGPTQRSVFLSGNGPLVEVLTDALHSRVFVKDLHRFIKDYGIDRKPPQHQVVVFDEAQRAWDSGFMLFKKHVAASEPDLLIDIGDRTNDWCVLVGLIGTGQAIFSGEEGGIAQWAEALGGSKRSWTVHGPPEFASFFEATEYRSSDALALQIDLRSRRADLLHEWVRLLLEGSLELANQLSKRIGGSDGQYDLYVTRSLDDAKAYARARYEGETDKRYGLIGPSHARAPRRHGVDTHFMAVQKVKLGKWFNAPSEDPASCCSLVSAITEFQVQGLELDLPIVCWGEDYVWIDERWQQKPARARYPQEDPTELLRNAYRVLLTRGRDGTIVFLPPEPGFDSTFDALLHSGMKELALEVVAPAVRPILGAAI